MRHLLLILLALFGASSAAHADTWTCYPNGDLEHYDSATGATTTTNEVNPFAGALSFAASGDSIYIAGDLYRSGASDWTSIGSHTSYSGNRAYKAGGISGLTVSPVPGTDAYVALGRVEVSPQNCTCNDITWEGIEFNAAPYGSVATGGLYAWSLAMNNTASGHTFIDCDAIGTGTSSGPAKSGWRLHGNPDTFAFYSCTANGFQEHGIYLDNARGAFICQDCNFWNLGRSCLQITNRIMSGPSGTAIITIDDLTGTNFGVHGAAGITIAGHMGPIFVGDCTLSTSWNSYGLVAWVEQPNGVPAGQPGHNSGAYKDAITGIACPRLELLDGNTFSVGPSNRAAVAVSGVGRLIIHETSNMQSNFKPSLWLDVPTYGHGPVLACEFKGTPNPASWANTWNGAVKMKWGTATYTDAQINALWVP